MQSQISCLKEADEGQLRRSTNRDRNTIIDESESLMLVCSSVHLHRNEKMELKNERL